MKVCICVLTAGVQHSELQFCHFLAMCIYSFLCPWHNLTGPSPLHFLSHISHSNLTTLQSWVHGCKSCIFSLTGLTTSLRMSTVVEPTPKEEEKEEEEEVVEREARRSRELSPGLMDLPALKFITRKDLYTFLSSAGVRDLFVGELCERIVGDWCCPSSPMTKG